MRFLADMGVAKRVVEWLRDSGHDVIHLRDQGLDRLPDSDVFKKAIAEKRVILTFDLDFGEIVALSGTQASTSVLLFRLRDAGPRRIVERLQKVLESSSPALESGAVVVVEEARHRVRNLPIGK